MSKRKPATDAITVKNNLETVPDSPRAADLFARMLRAVREQAREDKRQKSGGQDAA
jgi:hypothetical protein